MKVIYFDIAGRAEPIRLTMCIGKVSFEDVRVKNDWPELKPTMPWGSLPVIELDDGTKLAQSRALLRFVAKKVEGMYPEDHLQAQRVDEILEALEDTANTVREAGRGLEGPEKEAARKQAAETGPLATFLKQIEHFIEVNGKDGHVVGDKLTVADVALFCSMSSIVSGAFDGIPMDLLTGYPKIQLVRKQVASLDAVKAWYDAKGENISATEKVYKDARDI